MSPTPTDAAGGAVRRPLALAFETMRLVVATETLALPAGLVLAFLLFRTDVIGRRPMIAALAVAAFVPLPLHASAWIGAFGNAGRAQALGLGMLPVIAGWPGAAFVHATAALPWVVMFAGAGLLTVEPELEESALLDRPAWRVILGVTFRRAVGAVAASTLAAAVLTAGDMTVTDLLQVRTYAEEAYLQYSLGNGPAAAAAVALPPLVVLGVLVTLAARTLLAADPARLPSPAASARVWHLGPTGRVVTGLATIGFVSLFVGLPVGSLLWRAGRVGGDALRTRPPEWSIAGLWGTLRFAWDDARGPLFHSMIRSAIGATFAVVMAWALAWKCRRRGFWRPLTALALALALATPGPVVGMALVYGYRDWTRLYDSPWMIILAAVTRTFPFALLVLWPAVRSIPGEFLGAAAVDGLGPSGRVWRVAFPITRRAVVTAWAVAFTLALGELPVTNLVAPPLSAGETPLSVVIWGLLHTGVESHTAGVALVTLAAVASAGFLATLGLGWRQFVGR